MTRGRPKAGFRKCAVCRHPERSRIEMLSSGGMSLDRLAEKFHVNRYAVHRHMARHVDPETLASYLIGPAALADLALVAAEEQGSVLDHMKILRGVLFNFLDKAAKAGDTAAVTSLSTAILRVLKSLGAATGEIQAAASSIITVNNSVAILTSPPFIELQHGLIDVCRKHPEAREAIVALCARLDQKYAPAPVSGSPVALPPVIDLAPSEGGAHV